MNAHLLKLMYRIHVLVGFLEALHEALGGERSSEDTVREGVRLGGDMDQHAEPVQEALQKWMREKGCEFGDVPVILATEAYVAELASELERAFYREKPRIIVAESGGLQWLLERLADKYETETGLADYLHVEMFTQLPDILRRAKRVRPLILGREVPDGVGRRYREAVQSYLLGHGTASCALCRGIVEAALREAIERGRADRMNLDYVTLRQLIEDSLKLRQLPDEVVKRCWEVKRLGDKAAHGETVLTLDEAYEALIATQEVLKCVFRRDVGSPPRT